VEIIALQVVSSICEQRPEVFLLAAEDIQSAPISSKILWYHLLYWFAVLDVFGSPLNMLRAHNAPNLSLYDLIHF
jgi:hypothetical protein